MLSIVRMCIAILPYKLSFAGQMKSIGVELVNKSNGISSHTRIIYLIPAGVMGLLNGSPRTCEGMGDESLSIFDRSNPV